MIKQDTGEKTKMIPGRKLVLSLAMVVLLSLDSSEARKQRAINKTSSKYLERDPNEEAKGCVHEPLMRDPVCGNDPTIEYYGQKTYGSMEEFEEASRLNENLVFEKRDYCDHRHRWHQCLDKFLYVDENFKPVCAKTPGKAQSHNSGPETTYLNRCYFLRDKICHKETSWKIMRDGFCDHD